MSPGPVYVTGAAGLVGRAIAERLQLDGTQVVGVGRSAMGRTRYETAELDLAHGSLTDLRHRAPAAVVHCAALVPAPPERPDDEARAEATRLIDAGVLKACVEFECRLVYVSSCILYDPTDPSVKGERALVRAPTPYARAKLQGESGASALSRGLVMRIPSPVGELMPTNTVLPHFVARALGGQSLEVWGSGQREQDFIHVADIADFVALALRSGVGGTFNVASGRPVTMRRLAETVVGVIGHGFVVSTGQPDPLDGATARYNPEMARRRVGWSPRRDLESMVRQLAGRSIQTAASEIPSDRHGVI
jgi:nucleoside-diphosphate-sugar epimerase